MYKYILNLFLIGLLCMITTKVVNAQTGLEVYANDHPRLMFNYETISEVRDRVVVPGSIFYDDFSDMRSRADRDIASNQMSEFYVKNSIFIDLMLRDTPYYNPKYFNHALAWANTRLAQTTKFDGEGSGFLRYETMTLFYDWCYDSIPADLRKRIADRFITDNYGYVYNYSKYWIWDENSNKTWHYFATIVNDFSQYGTNNQYSNSDIVKQLENYKNHMANDLLPCWDFFSTNGAIDGYGGLRAAAQIISTDFYSNFTNYNPIETSTYLKNMPNFWRARLRPDGGWTRMPAKYNTSNMGHFYFTWFGTKLNDPYSQWIANYAVENSGLFDPMTVAWYDPFQPSLDPRNLELRELDFYDEGLGVYLGRSDYDLFNKDQTITVGFFNGPNTQVHKTQNHIFVAKGDRNLLIDANQYAGDCSDAYPQYADAYSHNTIMIYNPNSDPDYSNCNCANGTQKSAWYGGQTTGNEDLGDQMYDICNGFYGYRGEITQSEFNDSSVYLVGDATEVYKDRASKVERRFMYIRPGILIVQDYIVPKNNNDIVWSSMYHTINRPILDSSLNRVIRGNVNGGDMYYNDTKKIDVELEDAKCSIYFLPYKDYENAIRLIGGPNSQGKYWQQNHNPAGNSDVTSRYDSYITNDDISFEFYNPYDGKNYVPMRCGESPSLNDFNTRNRGNDPYYNANSAGQWRFMIESNSVQGEPLVKTHVIYIPETGDPTELDFNYTSIDEDLLLEINDYNGKNYNIRVDTDGLTLVGSGPGNPEDPTDPCADCPPIYVPSDPDTIYLQSPIDTVYVTETIYVPVIDTVLINTPCETDTVDVELKLQLIIPAK